ncbi:hypothetical protein GW17_00042136 [Ensete ventricosum]|nr:hypothetical protein GW17_00042136 [Ensete ventricosum]
MFNKINFGLRLPNTRGNNHLRPPGSWRWIPSPASPSTSPWRTPALPSPSLRPIPRPPRPSSTPYSGRFSAPSHFSKLP